MKENICVMDVYDENKNILNSQVIINNIVGFEIPKHYFFIQDKTSIKSKQFELSNGLNQIRISILENNKKYDEIYNEISKSYNITDSFINYREQRIIEFFYNNICCLIVYDKERIIKVECKCEKYSDIYYEIYYIVFSFDDLSDGNYNNIYYQKNNYIILKNGKYLYEVYNINILKKNPYEELGRISNIEFTNYLTNNTDVSDKSENYYLKSNDIFYEVKSKIDNYLSDKKDENSYNELDLLEEE